MASALFRGIAWWPAARRRGTARGGEDGDAWATALLAGAVVLDTTREQQRSGSTRRKSRAEWERGASGETWFLLEREGRDRGGGG
jgi:hypothetical protein